MKDIKYIINDWVDKNISLPEQKVHGWYHIDNVYIYREFTWTRQMSRRTIEEWDELVESMSGGWNDDCPIIICIGKDANIKVRQGNHRLGVAKELGLTSIPVYFEFKDRIIIKDDIGLMFKSREERNEFNLIKRNEERERLGITEDDVSRFQKIWDSLPPEIREQLYALERAYRIVHKKRG